MCRVVPDLFPRSCGGVASQVNALVWSGSSTSAGSDPIQPFSPFPTPSLALIPGKSGCPTWNSHSFREGARGRGRNGTSSGAGRYVQKCVVIRPISPVILWVTVV